MSDLVQLRSAKIIDLSRLGADPSGGTSSWAVFQSALVIQALCGLPIYAKAGLYTIDKQLSYTGTPKIFGDGIDRTIIQSTFVGGPLFMPSGTNCHMPGTCFEKMTINGPGSNTGTGEYFFQSQTFEANRNGIFRDLMLQYWDKCGIIVTDSYDNVFSNLRLWNIGDATTRGHGILHDRVLWSASNGYASTGNHFENISTMHCYRGIGVTPGNQIIEGHFKRVTGEFCDGTVETYAGTAPSGGWAGNCSFIGVYSEKNTSFGIKAVNGTEIECYNATYSGAGNNQSQYLGAFVRINQGRMTIGQGTTGSNPSFTLLNNAGGIGSTFQYNNTLFKTQILGSNGASMFSFYDSVAAGTGTSYAQISDPANTANARLYFGVGGSAFIDYGNLNATKLAINASTVIQDPTDNTKGRLYFGNALTTYIDYGTINAGKVTISSSVVLSNQANPQLVFASNAGTSPSMSIGVNGVGNVMTFYDVVAGFNAMTINAIANGGKVNVKYGLTANTGGSAGTIGTASLVAGVATINTSAVNANSKIFLSRNTPGGTVGNLYAQSSDIVAGTSFKITSSSNTDTSSVNWWIVDAL